MRSKHPSSMKIFGWPAGLFLLPLAAHGSWSARKRTPLNPTTGEREDVEDTWTETGFCQDCGHHTMHTFLLFVDEPGVVESECGACGMTSVREDLGR